jgi:hypothetical protein
LHGKVKGRKQEIGKIKEESPEDVGQKTEVIRQRIANREKGKKESASFPIAI